MPRPDVAVIVPTYGKLDVAERAVCSVPGTRVVVVDDAGTPDPARVEALLRLPGVSWHRFPRNDGLTRSWNYGLRVARDEGCRYAVCTNSDVIFSKRALVVMRDVLEGGGLDLVGPMTNAPGHQPKQNVVRHLSDFRPSDREIDIEAVAARLFAKNGAGFCPLRVNGFCMMARTEVWWEHRFDPDHVFNTGPRYRMIRNEDEFQGRAKNAGLRSGVATGAYVFHYRGVSRPGSLAGAKGAGHYRPGGRP